MVMEDIVWHLSFISDHKLFQVHGHDPSVSYPPRRSDHVFFHKVSKSPLIGWVYDLRWVSVWGRGLRWTPWAIFWLPMARTSAKSSTSRSFCQHAWWRRNAQVDIEGAELVTLPQWIESGILERVDQLGIELHLAEIHQARKMMVLNINGSTGYAPTCVRVEKIKTPL